MFVLSNGRKQDWPGIIIPSGTFNWEKFVGGRRAGRESRRVSETELRYFERNRDGLTHALSGAQGLPIGSGSIESLVRRVVNLRLKGSGMFWKRENAEAFIHIRCMLKSGNWNTLCEEIWGRVEVCA